MSGAVANRGVCNAMSVDVEEHFQVGAFENTIRREDWPRWESRVVRNTERALQLFADKGVSATFFTLGWVAQREPGLIRRIVEGGHEIANHGYAHDRVHTFTPESFRADIRKARALIEDAAGAQVKGYRAPSFSIGSGNRWALEVLAEEGYAYSSSVAPIRHDHYGWPEAPRFPHTPIAGSDMIEVPVTTVEYAGRRMACGGGGFFRLLPYGLSEWAIDRVNCIEGEATVFYFHPWEIDPEQPAVPGAPLKSRIRHYTNLDVMEAKLARLLDRFRWDRMDRVFLGRETLKAAA
ncbi:XrtA system polysaccharide deacetylase [Sphingosinicella soli]|uniref:Chitooligosaccharide deacetylase n=1 Tax=Sphingosinicella soli TaxID=333708 RepID=A0A7W7B0D0_9SPHN|nr:XrtA system polysaccharide deacetylase [Sphingosinicella soli]MBB4630662.1 polysaccharide deacetylase family protein (PEP-CTERM system associated) [Sphingosinicella soli]